MKLYPVFPIHGTQIHSDTSVSYEKEEASFDRTQTKYLYSQVNWTDASILFCIYNCGVTLFSSLEIFNLIWSLFNQDCFYHIIMYYICQLI